MQKGGGKEARSKMGLVKSMVAGHRSPVYAVGAEKKIFKGGKRTRPASKDYQIPRGGKSELTGWKILPTTPTFVKVGEKTGSLEPRS